MDLDCELAVIDPGRPVAVFGSIVVVSMKRLSNDVETLDVLSTLASDRPLIYVRASGGSLLRSQCIHRHIQE